MDRVGQMRAFVCVVESGSFSAAARRLGTTQSTISKQVAALERALGAALLTRTTRALTVTEQGGHFLEHARNALAAFEHAEAALTGRDPLAGCLTITAPPTLAVSRLMPMISTFLDRHPQVRIRTMFTDAVLDLGKTGIDLAIRVGRLPGQDHVLRRIGTARRVIVATPTLLDRIGRPVTPEDLTRMPCCVYTNSLQGGVWEFADGRSVTVGGNFASDNPEALRAAALGGMGLVLSATWLFESDLASGRLEAVLSHNPPRDMPIHLVTLGPASARAACLSDHLYACFAADALLAP